MSHRTRGVLCGISNIYECLSEKLEIRNACPRLISFAPKAGYVNPRPRVQIRAGNLKAQHRRATAALGATGEIKTSLTLQKCFSAQQNHNLFLIYFILGVAHILLISPLFVLQKRIT